MNYSWKTCNDVMMCIHTGANTNSGSIWTVAMHKSGFVNRGRPKEDPNLWPKQARRKEGNFNVTFVCIFFYSHLVLKAIINWPVKNNPETGK